MGWRGWVLRVWALYFWLRGLVGNKTYDGSVNKESPAMQESACNAEDPGSIPGSGRSPRDENDNPLQYSCLEKPMDREAWHAAVHGVPKSQT